MAAANVREASARVIVALMAAGRSRTTIKRHQAEYNAFAHFLEGGGQALPTRRRASTSSQSDPGPGLRTYASRRIPGLLNSLAGP